MLAVKDRGVARLEERKHSNCHDARRSTGRLVQASSVTVFQCDERMKSRCTPDLLGLADASIAAARAAGRRLLACAHALLAVRHLWDSRRQKSSPLSTGI